jgi:hypothetical protein
MPVPSQSEATPTRWKVLVSGQMLTGTFFPFLSEFYAFLKSVTVFKNHKWMAKRYSKRHVFTQHNLETSPPHQVAAEWSAHASTVLHTRKQTPVPHSINDGLECRDVLGTAKRRTVSAPAGHQNPNSRSSIKWSTRYTGEVSRMMAVEICSYYNSARIFSVWIHIYKKTCATANTAVMRITWGVLSPRHLHEH